MLGVRRALPVHVRSSACAEVGATWNCECTLVTGRVQTAMSDQSFISLHIKLININALSKLPRAGQGAS